MWKKDENPIEKLPDLVNILVYGNFKYRSINASYKY